VAQAEPAPPPQPRAETATAPDPAPAAKQSRTVADRAQPSAGAPTQPNADAGRQVASAAPPEAAPGPQPEAKSDPGPKAALEPETPAATLSIKQPRQTPPAIDRQTARELEQMLAHGRTVEAEQRLTELTQTQTAPRSREVFAREMLLQQMPARALGWLPESVTREHPDLRLLRARAQLQQGELQLAIDTLEHRLPPVDVSPEYRVTLATLLQRAGRAEDAASLWFELIAWDDKQPTWWLGLGLALEQSGQISRAQRAFAQAVTLPGLPANLAEFARQRMQALQAVQ
jgi:MSHA biogenesis protein MshN